MPIMWLYVAIGSHPHRGIKSDQFAHLCEGAYFRSGHTKIVLQVLVDVEVSRQLLLVIFFGGLKQRWSKFFTEPSVRKRVTPPQLWFSICSSSLARLPL